MLAEVWEAYSERTRKGEARKGEARKRTPVAARIAWPEGQPPGPECLPPS